SYPAYLPVIKYTAATGTDVTFNVTLGPLPLTYTGFISNNVANNSVDLVLTSGPNPPRNITWSGRDAHAGNAINGTWETTQTIFNWMTNGSATAYNDNGGLGGDFVTFDDNGAIGTVTLNATVGPASITVSNNTVKYTFTDNNSGYAISGDGALTKTGPGTLVLDNAGGVSLNGGLIISNGTVQVGNNDSNG